MGYFQVRYDSRVVNYDCRGFIRLAADIILFLKKYFLRGFSFYNEVSIDQ